MPRSKALDLIFRALVLNDIGTIEREDVILIGDLDDIAKLRQQPVLTADDDVMMRQDLGSYVAKIFRLENVKVDAVEPILTASLPDNVSIEIDGSSNQLVVYADIAYCQHVQQIVAELDNHDLFVPEPVTWRLRHADAEAVAANVTDLLNRMGQHLVPPLEDAPKPDLPAETTSPRHGWTAVRSGPKLNFASP